MQGEEEFDQKKAPSSRGGFSEMLPCTYEITPSVRSSAICAAL
jgi:hypothetical protein